LVAPFAGGTLVAVIDGLGHGIEAAAATRVAIAALADAPGEPVTALLVRCHEEMRGTRGAVMTLVSFRDDDTLTWVGVGNVEALLLRAGGGARESIVLR